MEQQVSVKIEDFVGIYDNAFSSDFCNRVIEYFENAEAAGYCYTRKQEANIPSMLMDDTSIMMSEESSYTLNATRLLSNEFLDSFWQHFKDYSNSHYPALAETCKDFGVTELKIQKTKPGQGFHVWHFEQANKHTSDRICAFQLYLNTVDEGGETEFLYYPKRIEPKAGRLIIWPGGYTHTHRGNPPLSNIKYVITSWVVLP